MCVVCVDVHECACVYAWIHKHTQRLFFFTWIHDMSKPKHTYPVECTNTSGSTEDVWRLHVTSALVNNSPSLRSGACRLGNLSLYKVGQTGCRIKPQSLTITYSLLAFSIGYRILGWSGTDLTDLRFQNWIGDRSETGELALTPALASSLTAVRIIWISA